MGKLLYSSAAMEIGFDDRALAHLQLVIGAKLRRGEKFFFSWQDNIAVGSGRSSIWLEPSIPLYFKFSGSKQVAINREWIEALSASANSSTGLTFLPEPGATQNPTPLPHSRV
ncbi:MAG: ATP-dependent ligase [Microbacteriaceae bacterium]|jgi:hypothetical protein|nr:ATP-dependent ligase [Microbacteriaceae bacterium]